MGNDLEKAKNKLERIALRWFTEDSILLTVYCTLDKKPDVHQDTIGVNILGRIPSLNYNPNFINKVSDERLELILVTEMLKILLRHCTTRLKEPRQISALASSVTINSLLNDSLTKAFDGLDDIIPNPRMFGLNGGLFFEQYYRDLLEKAKKVSNTIKKIWNSLTKKEKEQMLGMGNGDGDGNEESGGDKKQQGKPKQDKDSQPQKQEHKEFKSERDAVKDYYDPNGSSNDGWGQNDLFDADIKTFIDGKKCSAMSWGKYTGNIMAEIVAAYQSKISYKEILRRFKRSILWSEKISTRMKVNRRYDLLLPGHRREYKAKIVFAIDVSGSMSDDDIAEGMAVVNHIFKHAEIIFVEFDTELKYTKKLKKKQSKYPVVGRGGTCFQDAINFAETQHADGLIIFTDGWADVPKEPKNLKVLWLMHSQHLKPPVEWHYIAHLNRLEDVHVY